MSQMDMMACKAIMDRPLGPVFFVQPPVNMCAVLALAPP